MGGLVEFSTINEFTEFDIKNCSQKDSIQGGSLKLKTSVLIVNNYYEAKWDSNHLYIDSLFPPPDSDSDSDSDMDSCTMQVFPLIQLRTLIP